MNRLLKFFVYNYVKLKSLIYLSFYKYKNWNKKTLFIYTDSRGFEISKMKNRKSPFSSYIDYFIKNYKCDVFICPEKHTTTFDFLDMIESKNNCYDYIIAHIGVVDFSPRQVKEIEPILELKKNKIKRVFGDNFYQELKQLKTYKTKYFGELTSSLITDEFLQDIAKKFNTLDNLIWITCNPVDINWDGNYSRKRPLNINMVNDKSKKMLTLLSNKVKVIDLTNWNITDIHKYTCDNIHMSNDGMNLIKKAIIDNLK